MLTDQIPVGNGTSQRYCRTRITQATKSLNISRIINILNKPRKSNHRIANTLTTKPKVTRELVEGCRGSDNPGWKELAWLESIRYPFCSFGGQGEGSLELKGSTTKNTSKIELYAQIMDCKRNLYKLGVDACWTTLATAFSDL